MKKEAELKSPDGQAAWHYYQLWMRQLKRMPPPAESFLTSKYFRTFINFTKFTKSVSLPQPDKFIWLMVEKKYQPTLWMSDEVYVNYLEYLDRKLDPMEQAKISIDTLLALADRHDVDVSTVFDILQPGDVIQLLRVRKLSPWLLLFSKKFKVFFATKTNSEQQIIMEALIQPSYWENKMAQYPEEVKNIKTYIGALNI
jgi:hypothetical protein